MVGLNLSLGPASRLLFPQLGPASLFTWFFIVLASPQLFLHPASLDQLLETAKRHPDGFPVMHTHS
jgi:hypothetical protein